LLDGPKLSLPKIQDITAEQFITRVQDKKINPTIKELKKVATFISGSQK
jgi:hypothetical protein